ncbi:PVC-type heme-binding CxxCH protein [Humisphaera borealis]|uniref:HEAT repeat domain-containing protein n=1 Tax=Humisphaera borealis TaxID=2807512 RepID=A0A7M2X1L5_9BACT|nr:PVC-type heme-binding CxxCH protein [Humisphaera borealis]QOV91031.1 HEAT repeat domain-containing protein [Humisphaera borealis]
MSLRSCCLAVVLITIPARSVGAGEVTLGGRTLQVAEGFEVELVASAPLVERPISVSLDDQGRLYVTDSGGMSEKAEKQLAAKPHRIRRLVDSDGDGKFDTSTMFADRMMFPEGCLWHEGSLYVAAPPEIWKLTDADGDGVAEKREVWFDGKTLTGCGNDLHGPYLGRDGWFYWCKGAFAEQTHALVGDRKLVTKASHIFRSRPDGSRLESVLTGGMDNPVGVAFLSTGERILSCTFFQQPAAGRRDGLIHAIYGGVYGKQHDVLRGHIVTGGLMPVLSHQGAAAPAGIIAGTQSLWGGGHRDNLLACYFNLRKVVLHELIADGATYKTKDTDLLASEHPDFHPTDVLEDSDGSLLVVDTGGWYKVCCPTSVLARPDVMGAIYRIRKKGQAKVADPYGRSIAWPSLDEPALAALLADDRGAVRRRAAGELIRGGEKSVAALAEVIRSHRSATVRREAIWALSRIDVPAARAANRAALLIDPAVAHAAISAASLWRDRDAVDDLLTHVLGEDPALARAAAEALGRIGDRRAVPALLEAAGKLGDFEPDASGAPANPATRILEHSLIYALIEIGDAGGTLAGLSSPSDSRRRVGLVALDQMKDGGLASDKVLPLLDSGTARMRRTAAWIVGHHPEWGDAASLHFGRRLESPPATEAAQLELAELLARLSTSPAVSRLMTSVLDGRSATGTRNVVYRAMAAAGLAETPTDWLDRLAAVLPDVPEHELPLAVSVARSLPQPKAGRVSLQNALRKIGGSPTVAEAVRVDALLGAGTPKDVDAELFADLTGWLAPTQPLQVRGGAAAMLARAGLTADQQLALAETLRGVGPMELPKLLPAFERGAIGQPLGEKLVASLKASPGKKGLRSDVLKATLAKYPQTIRDAGELLLKELNASAAEQSAHLDKLLSELPKGDFSRGQAVFLGKKASCINCHAVGYLGGRLGPDLTNIGKTRSERDLLEAIVFPSVSFVRGYDPVYVDIRGEDKIVGIVTTESRDEIVVATGPQDVRRLPRSQVIDIRPSPLSLMPDGMEAAMTKQELADVIAFLKEVRR